MLLAPQVRYVFDKLIRENPNINLQLIDMKDYGLMDGKKVFNQSLETVE